MRNNTRHRERVNFIQKYKRKITKQDGILRCEICGWGFRDNNNSVNAHHIVPVASGGEDSEGNTVLLCPNHHAIAHYLTRQSDGIYYGPRSKSELLNKINEYETMSEDDYEDIKFESLVRASSLLEDLLA
jgi:predicted HNH restriction endonuclease